MKNWQITLTLFLIGYMFSAMGISLGVINYGLSYALVFGIGTVISKLITNEWNMYKKIMVIIAHIILGSIFVWTGLTGKPIVDDLEEIIGIFVSIALISILTKSK